MTKTINTPSVGARDGSGSSHPKAIFAHPRKQEAPAMSGALSDRGFHQRETGMDQGTTPEANIISFLGKKKKHRGAAFSAMMTVSMAMMTVSMASKLLLKG